MRASLAVVGLGGIGSYHLASMQKLAARGLCRVTAVVEPRAEAFADLKRELEAAGTRWYGDFRQMLREQDGLDAVTIATPIHVHREMTLACLERGLFVNLEKPPVPLVQQLDELIEADRGERVTVGFQMIASRCVQRIKQLIVEGAVGEVRSIRAVGCWPRTARYYQRVNWAGRLTVGDLPVFDGPATNALAHLVHNVMFLGSPQAAGFAVPVEVTGELYRARRIESYDAACLRGTFSSGAEFSLAVAHCTQTQMPFRIEVRGDRGWLRLSEDGSLLETSAGERLHAMETTQQLLDTCHERLVTGAGASGERAYTSLLDTVGYVRSTNAMFLSSEGIHDIDPRWITGYGDGDEAGLDVRSLTAAVERTFAEGLLFSELDLEWATARPSPVRLDSFQSLELSTGALQPVA